jgi:hypothetical protein
MKLGVCASLNQEKFAFSAETHREVIVKKTIGTFTSCVFPHQIILNKIRSPKKPPPRSTK